MKRVSLFGYAKTTKALAEVLQNVVFYDDKCLKPFRDENGFLVKPSVDFNSEYSDLEIVSPGIPPQNRLVKEAKNLMSEYDYFADISPFCIWISGTNGKTTTTQMMQYLLKDKGSQCGGNIGTPLAKLDKDADIWILETSSFSMHYTNKAKPNIYVLLPVSPDHISWHGSEKEYENAKLKPLLSMKEGEVAIVPKKYADIKTKAKLILYEDEQDIAQYFDIDTDNIKFKGAFLMDALLALSVKKILFDNIDYEKINLFEIEAHRQEEIKDTKGRLWVNDTKATNIDATVAALKRYKDKYIHLVLGGDDKGVELDGLFVFLKGIDVKIYNIGSNKQKLSNLAQEYGIEYQLCKNLRDAVKHIDANLLKDEVALLSPAAASLDEYQSYAKRGEEFRECVSAIS